MTGMELLEDIRDDVSWNMRVVFYTAYDKYMIQAIRESAFDYLLKPFEEQELKDILARFVKQAEARQKAALPMRMPLNSGQTFIVFTPTNDMRALRSAEIGFSGIVPIAGSGKWCLIISRRCLAPWNDC